MLGVFLNSDGLAQCTLYRDWGCRLRLPDMAKKHCSSISIGSFWPTRLPGMPRLVLGASRDCVGEVLQHVNRAIRLKPGEVVEFYSKSWENHPFSIVRFVENIVREREN